MDLATRHKYYVLYVYSQFSHSVRLCHLRGFCLPLSTYRTEGQVLILIFQRIIQSI